MPSLLAWIDHDTKARERTLRILSLFQEKESRDELGLGSVRDSFADQLFPGTSTIQTRLRYMLFVPWIYQGLEDKRVPLGSFATQAEKIERILIEPLRHSEDNQGTIGGRSGKGVLRLPASVYWAGLGTWGIRITPHSQGEYHRQIGEIYRRRNALVVLEKDASARGDDIDADQRFHALSWHPRLPKIPKNFPDKMNFALSGKEAEFIQHQLQANCPNSLLSFLALHCEAENVDAPWEHPDYGSFTYEQKELLTHARLYSQVMHGAALAYNIQLGQFRNNEELVVKYQTMFREWIKGLPMDEVRQWSLKRLWQLTVDHGHSIKKQTRNFVEAWIQFVQKSPDDLLINVDAMSRIKHREMRLKGQRSRFRNKRALEQWGGKSGIDPMYYRWGNVKVLLNDLYLGLQREK